VYDNELITEDALDELFHRSKELQNGDKFIELMDFVTRFRDYAPYNNMLVFLQNPNVTYYATAVDWWYKFHRKVKEDARPMVILAPKTPVLFVYDLADTDGGDMPELLDEPYATTGKLDPKVMVSTLENIGRRDFIRTAWKHVNFLQAGSARKMLYETRLEYCLTAKMEIRINNELNLEASYATLLHEIAHIQLGHLGTDMDLWWPDRRKLGINAEELEAESVSFLVSKKHDLTTKSAEYLSSHIHDRALEQISISTIMKAAGVIGKYGDGKQPDRKPVKMKDGEMLSRVGQPNKMPVHLAMKVI
jgi:hypothetical protein